MSARPSRAAPLDGGARRLGLCAALSTAVVGGACAAPPSSPAVVGAEGAPRKVARPPRRLCARELAHLEDDVSFVDGFALGPILVDGRLHPVPSGSAVASARAAPPVEPARRVVLDSALPDDWVIEAIILPNFARTERVDRPANGTIARVDRRGARGDVVALVRRELRGGLYDYVGACQLTRSFLAVTPLEKVDPRDITIRLSESGGRVYLDVLGAEPGSERELGGSFDE